LSGAMTDSQAYRVIDVLGDVLGRRR
jgi:hypothetical protein